MACLVCCGESATLECPVCHHSACVSCYQAWIVSRPGHDAACVYCRQALPMDLLYASLSREFLVHDFSRWRGHYLFEREKQYFVQEMPAVSLEIEKKRQWKALRSLLSKKRRITRGKAKNLGKVDPVLLQAIVDLRAALGPTSSLPRTQVQRGAPLVPCPLPRCRGFIMVYNYQCALCRTKVCRECLVPLDANHGCVSENRQSAQAILRDTKPCPQCAVRIHKISGCDQMWCVHCHSTFSWETLAIQLTPERVHNPHYFEWLTRQITDRTLELPWGDVLGVIHRNPPQNPVHYLLSTRIVRTVNHVRYVVLNELPQENENRALRHAFLKGECSQADMERLLCKREKRILKNQACCTMWRQVCDAVENCLWTNVQSGKGWDQFATVMEHLVMIVDNTEPVMEEIVRKYGGAIRGREMLREMIAS